MKTVKTVLVVLGLSVMSAASAQVFEGKGTVSRIGVNSYDMWGEENSTYLLLDGFSAAGSCASSAGMVVVRLPAGEDGNRQLALATASKMSGKEVEVSLDDTRKDSGSACISRWLAI